MKDDNNNVVTEIWKVWVGEINYKRHGNGKSQEEYFPGGVFN